MPRADIELDELDFGAPNGAVYDLSLAPHIQRKIEEDEGTRDGPSHSTSLRLTDILVPPNHRSTDRARVHDLSLSLTAVGMLNPITVRVDPKDNQYYLIAGRHRLEAAELAGWVWVPAKILDLDEIGQAMATLDENLVRREYTSLERAEALRQRKSLYEAKYPNSRAGAAGGSGTPGAVTAMAGSVGLAPRTIRDDISMAENLAPDVADQLRQTAWADERSTLHRLARLPHDEQRAAANRLVQAGPPTPAGGAQLLAPPAERLPLIAAHLDLMGTDRVETLLARGTADAWCYLATSARRVATAGRLLNMHEYLVDAVYTWQAVEHDGWGRAQTMVVAAYRGHNPMTRPGIESSHVLNLIQAVDRAAESEPAVLDMSTDPFLNETPHVEPRMEPRTATEATKGPWQASGSTA